MAFSEIVPVNAATSAGFQFAPSITVTDPNDPTLVFWNEVVAATAEDWGGFYVTVSELYAKQAWFGVAVGAAGAETYVAQFPVIQSSEINRIFVPISIPAGSRVSVCAVADTTRTHYGQVLGVPLARLPDATSFTRMVFGPVNLSGGFGTYGYPVLVDPGVVANTKSAWTELSLPTETANLMNGDLLTSTFAVLGFTIMAQGSSDTVPNDCLIDFAYGPSGSEIIFIADFHRHMRAYGGVVYDPSTPIMIPWNRPPGDRISIRAQSTTTNATVGPFWVTMIGLI